MTKSPKIASWPGILVSHKETRTKVVLARKVGKQGHGSSLELKTLVLPERTAKLNEALRLKEYLISAWKDHPPELYLRKLEEAKNILRQNMFLQNWDQMIINNGALLG